MIPRVPVAPERRIVYRPPVCRDCGGTQQLVEVVEPYGRGFGLVVMIEVCWCARGQR